MFSCEFCEISKNTFFTEHLWTAASQDYKSQTPLHAFKAKVRKWNAKFVNVGWASSRKDIQVLFKSYYKNLDRNLSIIISSIINICFHIFLS